MAEAIDISVKEYDENNTQYDDILIVNNPPKYVLDCNATSGYRVGGFVGSRNCLNDVYESNIGSDSNEPPYDDVDDYNGTTIDIGDKYHLKVIVSYAREWRKSDYDSEKLNFKFGNGDGNFTNIKRVYVYIYDNDRNISSISYYSSNIGHSLIKSILW